MYYPEGAWILREWLLGSSIAEYCVRQIQEKLNLWTQAESLRSRQRSEISGLGQLHFNLLPRAVKLYDAEAADLAGAGRFRFRRWAGARFPAILEHRAERR